MIHNTQRNTQGSPSRLRKWAWMFLVLYILGGLLTWMMTERPRFQEAASQVAIVSEEEKMQQGPQQYGFSLYQQRPIAETSEGKKKPFLYLVIDGIGLHQQLSDQVFKDFPSATTFSFSPYTPQAKAMMDKAWKGGHEVWVQLPIESLEGGDKGPFMLTCDVPADQNVKKLHDIWNTGKAFVGVIADEPSALLSSQGDLSPVIEDLKNQDLAILDASLSNRSMVETVASSAKIPHGVAHVRLLPNMPPATLLEVLEQAARQAQEKGFVVVVATLHPLVIQTLKAWWNTQGGNFVMAPLSQSLKVAS